MWTLPSHIVFTKRGNCLPRAPNSLSNENTIYRGGSNGYGRKLEENTVMDNASEGVILRRIRHLGGLFMFKVIRGIQEREGTIPLSLLKEDIAT